MEAKSNSLLLQREANALAMQQKWNSLDEGRHLTLNLLSKEIELRNGEVRKLNLLASCLNVFGFCSCILEYTISWIFLMSY